MTLINGTLINQTNCEEDERDDLEILINKDFLKKLARNDIKDWIKLINNEKIWQTGPKHSRSEVKKQTNRLSLNILAMRKKSNIIEDKSPKSPNLHHKSIMVDNKKDYFKFINQNSNKNDSKTDSKQEARISFK